MLNQASAPQRPLWASRGPVYWGALKSHLCIFKSSSIWQCAHLALLEGKLRRAPCSAGLYTAALTLLSVYVVGSVPVVPDARGAQAVSGVIGV